MGQKRKLTSDTHQKHTKERKITQQGNPQDCRVYKKFQTLKGALSNDKRTIKDEKRHKKHNRIKNKTDIQHTDNKMAKKDMEKKYKFQKCKRKIIKAQFVKKCSIDKKSMVSEANDSRNINMNEPSFQVSSKLPMKNEDFSSNWKAFRKSENLGTKKKVRKSSKVQSTKKEEEVRPKIWFDGVDDILLEQQNPTKSENEAVTGIAPREGENSLVKEKSFDGLTKTIAMDCEMVGVGKDGEDSILARISIVNQFGKCILDKFVKPTEHVTDYRTQFSGVRKEDIKDADEFKDVQKAVSDILTNRILVGHAIHNDLKVLYLDHPHKMIRDTQRYKPFRKLFPGRNPSLKKLTAKVLAVNVQEGEHSSVQDAQATMRLYTMNKTSWERELSAKWKNRVSDKRKKKKQNKRVVNMIDTDSE